MAYGGWGRCVTEATHWAWRNGVTEGNGEGYFVGPISPTGLLMRFRGRVGMVVTSYGMDGVVGPRGHHLRIVAAKLAIDPR